MTPAGKLGLAAVCVLFVLAVCALTAAEAKAEPNPNLCQYNPVRGVVPVHYALDACVDGDSIVVFNDGDFPVQLIARRTPDGHTDTPLTFTKKATSFYALATRWLHNDRLPGTMLLPGDKVRFEDGDNGASTRAAINVSDYDNYVLAAVTSNFVPLVGQFDAFSDLDAAIQDSEDQYSVCRSRPGLHGCAVRREARQVSAIATFLFDAMPGRKGVVKLAERIFKLLRARLRLEAPETALNDYDTVLTQGPRNPCQDGARLTIVAPFYAPPTTVSVGSQYYATFESILYTSTVTWGMTINTDWTMSGAPPGFYLGWTHPGETHLNYTLVAGVPATPGSYNIHISSTYRSPWNGQTCAVANYVYPLVVTEPPPSP